MVAVLETALQRPVILGPVERMTPFGVQFGPSTVPPTATDADTLLVEAIAVEFNPFQLLRRQFHPRIELQKAQLYMEQAADGTWLDLDLNLPETDPLVDPRIQVNPTVVVTGGTVIAQPYVNLEEAPFGPDPGLDSRVNPGSDLASDLAPDLASEQAPGAELVSNTMANVALDPDSTPEPGLTAVVFEQVSGTAQFTRISAHRPLIPEAAVTLPAQRTQLQVEATLTGGGQFQVQGDWLQSLGPSQEDDPEAGFAGTLAMELQQVALAPLMPAVLASFGESWGNWSGQVTAGEVHGALEMTFQPQAAPTAQGNLRIQAGAIALENFPEPLENLGARLRFQGHRMAVEQATARYGPLALTWGGLIDRNRGYDLRGELAAVDLGDLRDSLPLTLTLPLAGRVRGEATVTGPLNNPIATGRLEAVEPLTVDRVALSALEGTVIYEAGTIAFEDVRLAPTAGGELRANGGYTLGDPGELTLQVTGEGLPADVLGRPYGLPEAVTLGTVALTATLAGPWNALGGRIAWEAPGGTYPTRGVATVARGNLTLEEAVAQVGTGTVTASGAATPQQWDLTLTGQNLPLGWVDNRFQGDVANGRAQLTGTWDNLTLAGIQGSGTVTAAIAGGSLDSQFTLGQGRWTATVAGQGVSLGAIAPTAALGPISTRSQFSGPLVDFTLDRLQGSGTLTSTLGGGSLTSEFTVAQGRWQARGQGQGVQLAQLGDSFRGSADGQFQLAGSLRDVRPEAVRGEAQITLSQGLGTLAQWDWPPEASTPLTAQVAWDGSQIRIDEAQGAGLRVRGTLRPQLRGVGAPTLAAIDLSIQAQDYPLANVPGVIPVALGGRGSFNGRLTGSAQALTLRGDVALADFTLDALTFEPELAGTVAFSPQQGLSVDIQGERDQIVAEYQPQARQVSFRVQAGESLAVGNTEGDRLLARFYEFPLALVNLPPDVGRFGRLRGHISFASASVDLTTGAAAGQFQLADLGLGYLSVDGLLGSFAYTDGIVTLANGEIRMVDRSATGEILAQRFYTVAGRLGLGAGAPFQGAIATEEGTLQDLLTILNITELGDLGRGLQPPDTLIPRTQAEVDALLATTPVGEVGDSLLNSLRRVAEIQEVEVVEELATQEQPFPPLAELKGDFRGSVQVQGTLPRADTPPQLTVGFNLEGQSWRWGPDFRADQVIARGRFQDDLLTLEPLRFQSDRVTGPSSITVAGDLNLAAQGSSDRPLLFTLSNVPVDGLQGPLSLPFPITGALGGQVTLQGSLADPTLEGQLAVADGTFNNRPVEQATARFDYRAARLTLDSVVAAEVGSDPLNLTLALPYRPPFVTRRPVDTTVRADLQVQDDGLALASLFTNRLSWQGGQGELVASLRGTWDGDSPLSNLFNNLDALDGYLRIREATIGLQALPDAPLTDVVGSVRLAGLRSSSQGAVDLRNPALVVDEFRGNFSTGQLSAQGRFPIYLPLPVNASVPGGEGAAVSPSLQPLTLNLDNLALNLTGLYNGQVAGNIVVGGSLVAGVQLGGQVGLANGRITIPEGTGNGTTPAFPEGDGERLAFPAPQYSNLVVTLGENVQVIQGNLINVTAQGGLQVNGGLTRPEPLGILQLTAGRVNLLTTSLQLSGPDNRAEFRNSLDPLLRVSLTTTVPDAGRNDLLFTSSPFPRNEVPDQNRDNLALTQGGVRTIRIQAEMETFASQLIGISGLEDFQRVVRLTSSPPRSETEIFSLLGSDVFTVLGSAVGDSQGGQLEGVAGAFALNFVQNLIGGLIPLSDFRLFPVTPDSAQDAQTFDVAAEVGTSLSPTIAVSVLKVITNDTPFQFNLRYRISDQFTIRGTTSYQEFRERSGLLLEYETRF